jgi:hypothetical protein
MILLITPSARAQDCAEAFLQATNETAHVATTLQQAVSQLRAHEYSAVVIDQSLLDAEPDASEMLLQHIGMAMPVYVNFAISGIERVVRELRAALCRRKREAIIARQGAEQALRSELRGTVTALLLSCELALQMPHLPHAAETKIRAAYELAREMRAKIGLASEDTAVRDAEVLASHR